MSSVMGHIEVCMDHIWVSFYDSFPKSIPLTTHQEYIGKVPMDVHFKSVIFMTRKDVFTS